MSKNSGQFEPGKSGNPRGRPPKGTYALGEAELRKLLKKLSRVSDEAIDTVITSMREGKTPEVRLTSSKWLIEKLVQIQKELDVKLNKGRPDKEEPEDDTGDSAPPPVTLKLTM